MPRDRRPVVSPLLVSSRVTPCHVKSCYVDASSMCATYYDSTVPLLRLEAERLGDIQRYAQHLISGCVPSQLLSHCPVVDSATLCTGFIV